MEHITKFLECLAPSSVCNIKCDYCYLIQQDRRGMKTHPWNYPVEHVAKALSKKRLSGMAYISICALGETLVDDNVIELTHLLLREGHAVNITTNGTLSKKFDKLLSFPEDQLKRLNISFSFHYLELKKKNLIDTFFDNIKKVKAAGCSFVLQLNLYDGYVPYLDEIKKLAMDNVGAYPQIALTRKQYDDNGKIGFKIYTDMDDDKYISIAREFNSPLFECTLENFNVRRSEFCYAGLWSGVLNLKTGGFSKCYEFEPVNIFDDIDKPIPFAPVGKYCKCSYCVNSSHFMSLGVIPESNTPTYEALRNRIEVPWYNDTMKELLSQKFADNLPLLTEREKKKANINEIVRQAKVLFFKALRKLKRIFKG